MALDKTNRFDKYFDRAREALEQGFRSKADQARAISDTNTAFDYLKEEARKAQLNAAPPFPPEGGYSVERGVFFGVRAIPYQLNNIREKHLPLFEEFGLKLRPSLEKLLELRAAIKTAEISKAPKAAEPKAGEDTGEGQRMTCQICGRLILANTGHIAHHGFERPGYGYQTASCPGALRPPFEASRDRLGEYISQMVQRKDSLEAELSNPSPNRGASVQIPNQDNSLSASIFVSANSEGSYLAIADEYPRSLAAARIGSYKDLLEICRNQAKVEVAALGQAIELQTRRFEGWALTFQWRPGAKLWEKV